MDIVAGSQSTYATRNRSRSRSRSRSSAARGRGRTVVVAPRRSLRYNGVNQITRMASTFIDWAHANDQTGYLLNANQLRTTSFGMSFTPLGVYLQYGDFPTTNYTKINWPANVEFAQLYDSFRIDKVEVSFIACQVANFAGDGTQTNKTLPQLIVAPDTRETFSGTSVTEVEQTQGARWFNIQDGMPHKITVFPKFKTTTYVSPTGTGYAYKKGYVQSDQDIQHYGLKVSTYPNGLTIAPHTLKVNFKLYCSLKDVN